jgi:hypothetical protein
MIRGDVEVTEHRSPYKRIELHSRQAPYAGPPIPEESVSIHEKNRIWNHVVQSSTGTVPSSPEPEPIPNPCVCMT